MWNTESFLGYLVNPFLLRGVLVTIALTVTSMIGGLILGCVLAQMRLTNKRWVAIPAKIYVWFFRGTPVLVQLIVIFTGLPQLGIRFTVVQSVVIGLVLNEAAYLSEIIRGGIQSVPVGQAEAAKSLGLSPWNTMRLVVLPQAIRIIIPPLGNSVNGVLKATSIASSLSMEELLRRTQVLMQERFEVLELFAVACIYYLLLTSTWDFFQRRLEKRYGRGFAAPAGADRS
jgi:polar amino acid transport system permease protein